MDPEDPPSLHSHEIPTENIPRLDNHSQRIVNPSEAPPILRPPDSIPIKAHHLPPLNHVRPYVPRSPASITTSQSSIRAAIFKPHADTGGSRIAAVWGAESLGQGESDSSKRFVPRDIRPARSPSDFSIGPEELHRIVNFDNQNDPDLLKELSEKWNGVERLAALLRSDIHNGLKISRGYDVDSPVGVLGLVDTSQAPSKRHVLLDTDKKGEGTKIRESVVNQTVCRTSSQIRVNTIHEDSSLSSDMTVDDEEPRRLRFGTNVIPPPRSETIFEIIWGTIKEDIIIQILILGAFVTLVAGSIVNPHEGWIEGLAILMAVVIVLVVTAGNDYSKDKKFKKLLLLQSDKKCKVIRGGKKDQMSSWDLLVGDLVELQTGDEVPADGLFVRGNRLIIDESPLTGESLPVKKGTKSPFMFSGCQVSEGSGIMLVTAVGSKSSGGQIQELLNQKQSEETVLQKKLRVAAVLIGKIGFAAGVTVFLSLTIKWAVVTAQEKKPWEWSSLLQVLHFFVVGITMIVVAVPEGLPLAVTISLAYSMFKMIKDRCFVRHLDAAETMGEATCICTDKTGTLTENRMTVVRAVVCDRSVSGEGSGDANSIPYGSTTFDNRIGNFLGEAIATNSTCFVKYKENDPLPVFVGSATEGSLLVFTTKLGQDYDQIRRDTKKVENYEWQFTSDRKRMSTLIQPRTAIGGRAIPPYRLHTKGASEIVISLCTKILSRNGESVMPLSVSDSARLTAIIKQWASDGLRTIALAYKDFDSMMDRSDREDPEHDLTFVGLLGIKDPVRKAVPEAVKSCQDAGLTVRMVTGDNILTACKIAKECCILTDEGIAMEGPQFRALSVSEKKAIIPKLQVLARSSPADKHILVSLLKEMGEVVSVTGDGTNDAPALKEADVGFSMGVSGTQIAMNASDIVLLDDNFVSFVQSIKWGRNVLNSVRKFLQFQLSVNLVAIIVTIIGSLAQDESPLSPVQLLWVNLIMDTFGALGLASDVPDANILKAKPHSRTSPILTKEMKTYIIIQTVYQVVALLVLLFKGSDIVPAAGRVPVVDEKVRIHTLVFTTFVLIQVCNEITARQLHHELNCFHGFFANRLFPPMLIIILVIQTLIVQFGGSFLSVVPLTAVEWEICIIAAVLNIAYVTIVRFFMWCWRSIMNRRSRKVGIAKELESGTGGNVNGPRGVVASTVVNT
ncbi:hypothetical protein BKA69DRAFT_1083171 [Paraphysoderma sedebokerense]|nr:hypothetical protein BKA69DRAFT_1083171 [Paraphysoderma sedebokerense]